jgi:PAS domain S-box-containing protein
VLVFSAVALVGPVSLPALYRMTLPLGVTLLYALRWLVRRGRVRTTAIVLCAGGWLIVATDLQIHGPHTVAVGGFMLMIVIGGLTLGPVAALSLAGMTVALLAAALLGGDPGAAFATPNPWTRWLHYSIQLSLGSVLVAWWAQGMHRLVRHLRESEARHAQILEESPDATVSVDQDGVITFWNTAAEEMLGYPRTSFVGKRWDTVPTLPQKVEHVDRARANLADAMRGNVAPVHELDLVHRSGRTVTVEVKSVPMRRGTAIVGVISTVRDVSARKQAENERAVLEEQLVSSQRMETVGRFAGGIAHDFNNILTIIYNAAEVFRSNPGDTEAVKDVLEAAARGTSLTRQLLTFSKHQPSEARPTELRTIILALRPMLARLLGDDVVIDMNLDAPGTPVVNIGPGQLDQIVMNLAINARDAMPQGGTIRVAVRVLPTDTQRPLVELTFSDTGIGMDASTVAQAFEPFFSTKGERGTGLGLSIVKRIVDHAGGAIACESEPGRGTIFRIILPLVAVSPAPLEAKSSASASRGVRRVVLVDDDPLVRAAVARALQNAGVVVEAIATPLLVDEVEARLRDACALVTDVVMPGMTGPDLVDELRRRGCRTPVIFVSGYAEHALLERIRSAVNATLVQKPFTAETILARLDEIAPRGDAGLA